MPDAEVAKTVAENISAVHLVLTAASTLVSGLVGGWVAAIRSGRRQQKVEDDIESLKGEMAEAASQSQVTHIDRELMGIKERLGHGDAKFERHAERLAALVTRMESAVAEFGTIRAAIGNLVTREECRRSHEVLASTMKEMLR